MANLSAFGGAQPITPGGEVEVGYVSRVNNYTSTATTPGAAPNIFSTDLTIVADGVTPYTIEFYAPEYHVGPNAPAYSYLYLYQDGSLLYQSNPNAYADGTYNSFGNAYQKWRIVPTAGTHTYNVRATASLGTAYVTSNVTNYPPSYLRACKIVQQNDGLKPFWTPPIVTQLPSNATVGDQVVYAADATNGVYWSLYYDGIGTYPWKFVGGGPLTASAAGGLSGTITSTGFVAGTPDLAVALPLSGDYWTTTTALGTNNTAGAWWMLGLNGPGSAVIDQFCARVMQHAGGNYYTNGAHSAKRTFTSSGTVQMRYRVTTGIATIAERGFSLTPIRVAA
jgi:hypothetical protein